MRVFSTVAAAVVVAALSVPLDAQQNIKWIGDGIPTGLVNAFPWGSAGVRYQVIAPNTLLGERPALVQDLFVAGGYSLAGRYEDLDIVYDDIEIRLGMTNLAVVTNSWAANNPNPVTVYRGRLRVAFKTGKWRAMALPRSFPYTPSVANPHLCIEIISYAVRGQPQGQDFYYTPASSVRRAYAKSWVTVPRNPGTDDKASKMGILLDDGSFAVIGAGCTSSTGTQLGMGTNPGAWPQLGRSFRVTIRGAKPLTAALLMIGRSDVTWGPITLPVNLGPAGAPGCFLWNDKTVVVPTATDANGSGGIGLAIPNSTAFSAGRAVCSWAALDPAANALGWTSSDYMRLIIGS